MREPIIDGNLTLITPYHPAARFNVGHAMRRNALIYCMAEAAVVVASSPQKGGTTAGALENLKAAWVPLYVRDDGSKGNDALIRQGALPLPTKQLDPDSPLLATAGAGRPPALTLSEESTGFQEAAAARASRPFQDGQTVGQTSVGAATPSPTQVDDAELTDRTPVASGTGQDIFVLVWPRLAAYLLDERSEREVAESFEIELSQTRAWLKRAVAEGLAQRLTSKRRYVVSGQQRSLFAADR